MKRLILVLAYLLLALPCRARIITVDDDGPADFDNIQAAINDANDGDTIIVAPGTYTGPGNRDIDFLGKAITVRSENGPNNCVIDCNGTTAEPHRGFYFHSGEGPASALFGFTIRRGAIYGSSAAGGGIYCGGASPRIENCIITDNKVSAGQGTAAYGGGISIGANSSPVIENCIVSDNQIIGGKGQDKRVGRSAYGAGIYCGHSAIINRCRIYNNQATGGKGGRGFFRGARGGGAYGAGISCLYADWVTISNSLVSGNRTVGGKGGYGYSDWRSDGGPAYGGGLFLRLDAESIINNCIVTGNEVKGGERGEGQYGGSIGDAYGAGIEGGARTPGEAKIQNCIIWDNRGDEEISNSNAAVTYSNVKGGYSGTGNIKADPLFLEPGFWDANGLWVEGDYHFWPESPCVDTGDPNYIAGPSETDIDGLPRVIGGRVDMGAYEFNHQPVADAGPNQVAYAWIDGFADVNLDGSASYDDDNDVLDYYWNWTIDGNTYDANGVSPVIELPVGEHIIELIVSDGIDESEPDYVVITVVEPMELELWVFPRVINRKSRQPRIMAWLRLPQGVTKEQIDRDVPLTLYPGGIEATRQYIFNIRSHRRRTQHAIIFAYFDKAELLDAVPDNGPVVLQVAGRLKTSQYFYGSDTIRIIAPRPPHWPPHH